MFSSTSHPLDGTVVIAPEAPDDLSWWPYPVRRARSASLIVQNRDAHSDENEPYLLEALRMLAREIDALEQAGVRRNRIVLTGFSQGAILVNTYALSLAASDRRPSTPLAAIIALAGDDFPRIPSASDWATPASGDGPVTESLIVSCGAADQHFRPEVIRNCADRLASALGQAIVQLELLDGVGHYVRCARSGAAR